MAKLYRSRENTVTALNTKTQLTVLGSQTAPGALLVPGGMSYLQKAIVSVASNNATAESGAALIRLEGPGIHRGNFVFAANGLGAAVAGAGDASAIAHETPIGIKVIPGQEILLFAEMLGTDLGTLNVGITLVFANEAGPGGEVKGEITVAGDITAVDTLVRLTAQGSVTAPSRLVPPDANILKRIIVGCGTDQLAVGDVNVLLRLGGDAIKGGEQTIFVAGHGTNPAGTPNETAAVNLRPFILEDVDIEVTPNETLDISVEMVGEDVGDVTVVATAVFA